MIHYIHEPPRCPYYRAASWWEIIKVLFSGDFDRLDHIRQCSLSVGHTERGYPLHEDVVGNWWRE